MAGLDQSKWLSNEGLGNILMAGRLEKGSHTHTHVRVCTWVMCVSLCGEKSSIWKDQFQWILCLGLTIKFVEQNLKEK